MKKRLVKEKSSFHAAHKHNNDSVDFGDQHHDNYVVDNAVGHVDVDDDHRSAPGKKEFQDQTSLFKENDDEERHGSADGGRFPAHLMMINWCGSCGHNGK